MRWYTGCDMFIRCLNEMFEGFEEDEA